MKEMQDILLATAIAHDIERFFEVNFGSSEEGLKSFKLTCACHLQHRDVDRSHARVFPGPVASAPSPSSTSLRRGKMITGFLYSIDMPAPDHRNGKRKRRRGATSTQDLAKPLAGLPQHVANARGQPLACGSPLIPALTSRCFRYKVFDKFN